MDTINDDYLTVRIPAKYVERVTKELQRFYSLEKGTRYSRATIRQALERWFEEQVENNAEDVEDLLTSPFRKEARQFGKLLTQVFRETQLPAKTAEESVFTGFREFSAKKLAAMTSYIAKKGHGIYKTKLNKLLFYSDFVNYYMHGHSISGSRYVHLPFGPVPDRYERMISDSVMTGNIKVSGAPGEAQLILPAAEDSNVDDLTREEIEALNWVLKTYGKMSAGEITEQSHKEKAYKFTKPGEEVAYEYAKFFENLPPKREPIRELGH
jgi:uncharacterized phage-associated protein